MPWLIVAALLLLAVCGGPAQAIGAQGSWWIDRSAFHVSAHGTFACTDCHENVLDRAFHPDPRNVNRDPRDAFFPGHCLDCHDAVAEEIQEGLHAGEPVEDPEAYQHCLDCHDPHEQMRADDLRAGRLDPSRPLEGQCGACHEARGALPAVDPDNETCVRCHGRGGPGATSRPEEVKRFCFHCHAAGETEARRETAEFTAPIHPGDYASTPHAELDCTVCHLDAARYPHDGQNLGDCGRCHERHDEKVAHDAHARVDCGACHLEGTRPVLDPASARVTWERVREGPSRLHHMTSGKDEAGCRRCHAAGNTVGAVAMVLPPKSILCMPCHAATFSMGDTTTVMALVVFLAGMALMGAWVFSGSREAKGPEGRPRAAVFRRIGPVVRVLFWDGLLQRRLFRRSPKRWTVHALIFWPFVIRFLWGIAGLLGSLWTPSWEGVWTLLDKNHPVTALVFDATGLALLLGVLLALFRGPSKASSETRGLPRRDRPALLLILAVTVAGFVLEGMRVAMTGAPPGSGFAFAGYALSALFSGLGDLTTTYGVVWYVHAVLTGAFVAYLPFSRLIHVIMAPVVLAMNAGEK